MRRCADPGAGEVQPAGRGLRQGILVRRLFPMGLAALGAAGLTGFSAPATPPVIGASSAADTVHVAPPTGEREVDRASILIALDQVEPGGTVLFAPGTRPSHSLTFTWVPRRCCRPLIPCILLTAFSLSLEEFLGELSRRVAKLRDSADSASEKDERRTSAESLYVR